MAIKRKLASVQYIHDVSPIEGADSIECVSVLGWKCVAKKGEFKKGSLCVYFEVDSFLPIKEEFEFLRKSSYKNSNLLGEGFRLKTMRMRGQISQGLVLPITYLPPKENGELYSIGDDVTDVLGVRKWEIEEKITNFGNAKDPFPDFISKSDEIRIQSIYEEIDKELIAINDEHFDVLDDDAPYLYITTKMDGSSVTLYKYGDHIGICSRNLEIKDDGKSPLWDYFRESHILDKFAMYCSNNTDYIAIQGEFCGPGIQNNRLKLVKPEWYVFTVQEILPDKNSSIRKGYYDLELVCAAIGAKHVPVEERLSVKNFLSKYKTLDSLLERARGKYTSGMDKEGIVIRTEDTIYSPTLRGPFSFKVINNDYLLKEK